jgi:hypothetical protein
MMKKKHNNMVCSPLQAERYLLNRMTANEEDRFQQHLEHCSICREYLKRVRTLSALIGDEDSSSLEEAESGPALRRRLRTSSAIAIAASLALLLVFSLYWVAGEYPANGLTSHIPFIREMSRANGGNVGLQVLFPDRDTVTFIISEKPLVLKWNMAAGYKLTLRSGGKKILQAKGFSDHYSFDREDLLRYRRIDWTLDVGGFARKEGHIILKE